MNKDDRAQRIQRDLESRILKLEEQARFTLDILEMASNLGDFQAHINKLQDPTVILRETIERVQNLIPFQSAAFLLVDEASQDFSLHLCEPKDQLSYVEQEVDTLIENGIFPMAVRENRPIIVYSSDMNHRLVLHVLATNSRTRGMFVGLTSRRERGISGILLSLLSIILKNCANAIESFELYRLFREQESCYRSTLQNLPLCAFSLSRTGLILCANRGFEQLFGRSAALGEQLDGLRDFLAEDSRRRLEGFLELAFAGQAGSIDMTASQPGGDVRPFRLFARPITRKDRSMVLLCQGIPLEQCTLE